MASSLHRSRWRPLVAAAIFVLLPLVLAAAPAAAQGKTQAPPLPDRREAARLIWTSLIALDQANRTGNYTVLRDLAAPSFQRTNDAARLAAIFARLRKQDIGLDRVVLETPVIRRGPEAMKDGRVRISGFFPTRPEGILFDLIFERVGHEWRLYGISVAPSEPPPVEPGQVPAPRPAKPQPQ